MSTLWWTIVLGRIHTENSVGLFNRWRLNIHGTRAYSDILQHVTNLYLPASGSHGSVISHHNHKYYLYKNVDYIICIRYYISCEMKFLPTRCHLIPPVSRNDEGGIWWRVTVQRIPHEKQYHVTFISHATITSDWIQTFFNVIINSWNVGCERKPNCIQVLVDTWW